MSTALKKPAVSKGVKPAAKSRSAGPVFVKIHGTTAARRSMGGNSLMVVKAFKGDAAVAALKSAGVLTADGKLSAEFS